MGVAQDHVRRGLFKDARVRENTRTHSSLCVMAGPVHIAYNELGRLVAIADHMLDDMITQPC